MRFEGTLHSWDDDRGFGFLLPSQGGQEIFVHIQAFARRGERPRAGQRFTFEVELGPQGKKRARKVEPLREAPRRARRAPDPPAQWGTATFAAIPAFLLLAVAAAFLWKVPAWTAPAYLVASFVTYCAYHADKKAARTGAWRTSEATLHALSLAGGWPGALLAQQFLRHKSAKAAFRARFWCTVALNVGAFVALASPAFR